MEKRKANEGEIEKEEANNLSVSFFALCKDVANVLDFMERLKNEEDQNVVDVTDQIEKLKFGLAFIYTYIQLSYSELEEFKDIMTSKRQEVENLLWPILDDVNNVGCKYGMHHVFPSLRDNIYHCINSCNCSKSSATMTEEQLNFLLLNLHHLSKYHSEKIFPLVTQYDILQNVCGNVRDFHGLVVNGCIEHEIVEYVIPQFELMAESVGLFLWNDQTDGDSRLSKLDENVQNDEDSKFSELDENDQNDEATQLSELDENDQNDGDSRLFKLAHLFLKIIPIELEVMHICYTNLKVSTSEEVGCFIKKLLETSPDILREYLIHLQEHMVTVTIPSTSGTQNIHVMIEFLLIILSDMPKDFIHHDKLFDLLARVGALTREVSTLVHDLEEKSKSKGSTNRTNRATLDLLENIEHLKETQTCLSESPGPMSIGLPHE